MTADSIIAEIKQLAPADQAEVIRFAIKLAGERKLTGAELARLAQRMAESDDPAEVERLRSAITEGFYGEPARA
ncbi:MAG TPA: hypothetical protein DCY13_11870 [Verrucomicrobiales bacterium]|nr:hypothetical protein [Verrucomicrobiales bacterium]